MAVDDFSGKMFVQFSGTKTQMTHLAEKVIKRCEGEKKEVKYIRMDGGGENKGIEDLVEEMGGITIEKTPPHTPQYNGRIERRFPIIVSMTDFAKDPVTRKSVGGELHTLGRCITAFSSRGRNLSRTARQKVSITV